MPDNPRKRGSADRKRLSRQKHEQAYQRRKKSPAGENGGRGNSRADAIAMLKLDHTTVRGLLDRLNSTTERASEKRKDLLRKIQKELMVHTRIEEKVFYPAFKEAANKADEHLYYEAFEEHALVDIVLPQLEATDTDSEEFAAKAKVLMDLIEHHADEEETQMFPKARKVMTAEELRQLGDEIRNMKQDLEASGMSRAARTISQTLAKVSGRRRAA